MNQRIQAVRGMNDALPEQTWQMNYIEAVVSRVFDQYGYQQVILPIVEKTELFDRGVGEVTDIVEKEMYTFEDRNGTSLSLRPEGTAGCVRAGLEHGLFHNQTQRLWYYGPMFRRERPQKGRYRQFFQVGVEMYGITAPSTDVEMLIMQQRMWEKLGIADDVTLELNTLGSHESRMKYREVLVSYCKDNFARLDDDSKRRLNTNPLRILDSKNPDMKALIDEAPEMGDYLDEASKCRYETVKQYLDACDIQYVENPQLVRGLDYYCHTVFEWTTDKLGAQGTISAGGRYDSLVEKLGGRPCPAVGFALGLERLSLLMAMVNAFPTQAAAADVYLVVQDNTDMMPIALALAEKLRANDLMVIVNHDGGAFKSQFKKADKSGAETALIIGEEEVRNKKFKIKHLQKGKEQSCVQAVLDKLNISYEVQPHDVNRLKQKHG